MSVKSKGRLGRGLSALIPEADLLIEKAPLNEIDISLIRTRANQPRTHFDPTALAELVESIRAQGVLQPLLITPRDEGYEIVAGERRLRAARAADLLTVPCRILKDLDEHQILEISLVENLQREDLNPLELAEGYRRLIQDLGLSQQQVAERVGKDRATVANTLRLLKLPDPVRDYVREGKLSAGHARALLAVESDADKVSLAHRIVKKGLSVREVENYAKQPHTLKTRTSAKSPSSIDLHSREVAKQVETHLGMPVQISHRGPGGKVTIHYQTLDELDHLVSILQGRKVPSP